MQQSKLNLLQIEDLIQKLRIKYKKPIYSNYLLTIKRLNIDVYHLKRDLMEIDSKFKQLNLFHQTEAERTAHSVKSKRSILPFIGSAAKFLFGTVTENDLYKVKNAIRKLVQEQSTLRHVVRENLSIVNVTRTEIKENRHTINAMISTLHDMNSEISNVTNQIQHQLHNFEEFMLLYLHTDLIIQEVRETTQRAVSYINTINQQLNAFASGIIPQSVISPQQLQSILISISRQLPSNLILPADPLSDIWFYFKTLRCILMTRNRRFLVISSLHLNDVKSHFNIFHVINVPIGLKTTSMVGFYKTDANLLALSTDHTQYMKLSDNEASICIRNSANLCAPDQPIFPTINSKSCTIALFLNKDINQNCHRIVRSDIILPQAFYIFKGTWVVTLREPLKMTLTCHSSTRSDITLQPYYQVIMLESDCHAYSDKLILPSFFQRRSEPNIENSFATLLTPYNQSNNPMVWKPFIDYHSSNKDIKIPDKMKNTLQIPMSHLIKSIDEQKFQVNNNKVWSWKEYVLLITVTITLILIGKVVITKFINNYRRLYSCVPCDGEGKGEKGAVAMGLRSKRSTQPNRKMKM